MVSLDTQLTPVHSYLDYIQRVSKFAVRSNSDVDFLPEQYEQGFLKPSMVHPINRLHHGLLGASTELGESLSEIKSTRYYGKLFNLPNFKAEIGDAIWFLSHIIYHTPEMYSENGTAEELNRIPMYVSLFETSKLVVSRLNSFYHALCNSVEIADYELLKNIEPDLVQLNIETCKVLSDLFEVYKEPSSELSPDSIELIVGSLFTSETLLRRLMVIAVRGLDKGAPHTVLDINVAKLETRYAKKQFEKANALKRNLEVEDSLIASMVDIK